MTLYRKYRPETLDQVVGNAQTVRVLQDMLKSEDKPQSFLLTGPTGCGKTTIGRILAREFGATGSDFKEVDSILASSFLKTLARKDLNPNETEHKKNKAAKKMENLKKIAADITA